MEALLWQKNESPQKAVMREMMRSYIKDNDIRIKNGTDVNAVMRNMMSVILEDALDEELDEEPGYSKYDYRNKDTDNSRNGHSKKAMHNSYEDILIVCVEGLSGFPQAIEAVYPKTEIQQCIIHQIRNSTNICAV